MIKFPPPRQKPAKLEPVEPEPEPEPKRTPAERAKEILLTQQQLAHRWNCHVITLRRMKGLKPVRFTRKFLRYRLSDVEAFEEAKAVK